MSPMESSTDSDAAAPINVSLRQDDLEAVAVVYDIIRDLYRDKSPEKDGLLALHFDEQVKVTIHNLVSGLNSKRNEELDVRIQIIEVIYTCQLIFINYGRLNLIFTKFASLHLLNIWVI